MAVWLLFWPVLFAFHSSADWFWMVNQAVKAKGRDVLDETFTVLTWLGEGYSQAILGAVFLLVRGYKRKWAWRGGFMLTGFAISSLISLLCKQLLFHGVPRPKVYFERLGQEIYTLPWIKVHGFNSFPSGHSITAFSLFTALCLFAGTRHKFWQAVWLVLAMLSAFSRVYLGQHFPIDIYVGGLIGFLVNWALLLAMENYKPLWAEQLAIYEL